MSKSIIDHKRERSPGRPRQPPRPCESEGCRSPTSRYNLDGIRVCSTCKQRHVRAERRDTGDACDIPGCSGAVQLGTGPKRKNHYCRSHEDRLLAENPGATQTTLDYIAESIIVRDGGCWEYTGRRVSGAERPQVWCNGLRWYVVRLLYVYHFGPHRGGLELHHLCGQRQCVNPEHLLPIGAKLNKRIEGTGRIPGGMKYTWAELREATRVRVSLIPQQPTDPAKADELSRFAARIKQRNLTQ